MGSDHETLAEQLGRVRPEGDALEGERLRNALKAQLLDEPPLETRIDRFVVLGQLGAGGMGIVYAAYDPELDRKVAIKLVRSWGTPKRAADQQRLVREARALARLSHPNIVSVYEVGIHGDDVFVAMEFVRGRTLREHFTRVRAGWQDIVRAYLQAGQGLAAAHDVGLVHRDFKPDNVLIGDDGRVRVLDFGIARDESDEDTVTLPSGVPTPGSSLTQTGAMLGTLAYMAPEQRLGLRAGPGSDQFSFCVALHEALCGTPPKRDADGLEHTSTLGSQLPTRLRRAVARGLSAQLEDRFADMHVLLAELRATVDRGGLRRTIVLAGAIGGVAAGVAAAGMFARGQETCPEPVVELAQVWNDDARARLQARANELGDDAVRASLIVERELDRRGQAWLAGRVDACEALWVHRSDSADSFDRRSACLARSRHAMSGLIELLAVGDGPSWAHAVEAVTALAPIESCDRADGATSGPSDAEGVAGLERVRAGIDRVSSLAKLGRLDAATELAETVLADALTVGDRSTEAEALAMRADLEEEQAREDRAEPLLEDALWRAEAASADALTIDLLVRTMQAATARGNVAQAASIDRRITGVLERVGRDESDAPNVVHARYRLAMAEGRLDDAEAHARTQLAVFADRGRSLGYSGALTALGLVEYQRGDYDGAAESFTEALAIDSEWLDEHHTRVLRSRINLAGAYERLGRTDEARAALHAVIADADHALVEPGPVLSMALDNLANLEQQAGNDKEALVLVERSLAVLEGSVGPDDPRLLQTLIVLGNAQDILGRRPEARTSYERALALGERIDPQNPEIIYPLNNLAEMELNTPGGDKRKALEMSTRALDLWTRVYGDAHPVTGQLAFSLAHAELANAELAPAIAHARQAIAILAVGGSVDAPSLAGAQFLLAKALAPDPAQREAALAAARAAAAAFGTLGAAENERDVQDWITRTFP